HRPRLGCREAPAAPYSDRRLRSGKGTGGRWCRPGLGLAGGRPSPALHRRSLECCDRGRTGDRRDRESTSGMLRRPGEAGPATGCARQHHPASVARWSRVTTLTPEKSPEGAEFLQETAIRCTLSPSLARWKSSKLLNNLALTGTLNPAEAVPQLL